MRNCTYTSTTRVVCGCCMLLIIFILSSTPLATADLSSFARVVAEKRARLGQTLSNSETTAALWIELRRKRIEKARAKFEGRPYVEQPKATPSIPDNVADAAMRVATTQWPDDFINPKPILQHLHTLKEVDDDHHAWSTAQQDKEAHQALDDWEELIPLLHPRDLHPFRVPQEERAAARTAVNATGPMVRVRNECSTLLWFVAMPARPPASGALRRQWIARVRHLRVAIASAATHRARLVPVVVFVSQGASQKTSRSYTRTDPVMKYLHAWLTSHRVHMVDWQLRVGDALATAVRGDPHEWQYVHRAYKLLPMDLPLVAAEVLTMHLNTSHPAVDTTRYLYTDAAVMFRAGVDSCSFNTSSDAQVIMGSGVDPWAPTVGSMLLITDHAAKSLWRPLSGIGAARAWRIPGGFEELLWKFVRQQQNVSNPTIVFGLMPPSTNFKGFWLTKAAPTVGVVHFWGPKPLGCLPCLVGEDLARPASLWNCNAVPPHCETRPMRLVKKLLGSDAANGLTARFLREWHLWDGNISQEVSQVNVTMSD